ncbi:serine/threonine protein kinase [Actinokineospora baliensis]|nr:serine/threonine protein kinase [Actinokineospora baliensis]
MRPEIAHHANVLSRFLAVGGVDHLNVVSVSVAGEHDGQHYLVMEHVPGDNLDVLGQRRRFSLRDAVTIVEQVCAGLAAGHRTGATHGDIKPTNVMVGEAGEVKILGFGASRLLDESEATARNPLAGAVHYMSPEQIDGGQPDARSDVYSAGCLLHKLLTGSPPFTATTAVKVALKHLNEAPQLHDLPTEELRELLATALAKNPLDRFQTADDMRTALLAMRIDESVISGTRLPDPALEPASGDEWLFRYIPGSAATKIYRCPRCDHEIRPGLSHVVAWPASRGRSVEERRHWHTMCWQHRDRSGSAPNPARPR